MAGILLNTYKELGYDNPNQVVQNKPVLKDMNKRALTNSIGSVKIEVLTPDGDVYETWELYNAFVSKISFDGLQYSSTQLIGASVTLSYDWAEMKECVRITPPNDKCGGCFNRLKLDAGDWNWCPVYKGSELQHICQQSITVNQVFNIIKADLDIN